MRITKDQANDNRERVIETASRLFRERGFDGVSVAELMAASGFTHGGFYNHFKSKEALSVEALRHAFGQMAEDRARAKDWHELIAGYLSDLHRRSRGKGCPAAALAGDAARQTNGVKSAFAGGLEEMIRSFGQRLPRAMRKAARRREAVEMLCTMAGALALARAIPEGDRLAREILQAARDSCGARFSSKTRKRPG